MLSSDNEAQKGTTKDNFSFSQKFTVKMQQKINTYSSILWEFVAIIQKKCNTKFTIEMNARQFSDRYRSRIGYAKPVTNNHEAYFGQRERSLQKW